MFGRHRLIWRLSAAVTAIVALVIIGTALVCSLLTEHYVLQSIRGVLNFNSISVRSGIDKLMMSRDNNAVPELIEDVAQGSEVYRDIRLISHPAGEVIVSRLIPERTVFRRDESHCVVCHTTDDTRPTVTAEPLDSVLADSGGERIMHVVTPILNKVGCRTAACHAHAESGLMLGFLETDYTLERVDTLLDNQRLFTALSAIIAVILASSGLLMMFRRLLDRPLRQMVTGIRALAGGDLSFRFSTGRQDEIGLAEESFNRMASSIQAHQKELRDAVEYLEGIVENSADLIITVNPDGLIQTFNRGAEDALGYKRNEVVGQRVEMIFADPRERNIAIARLQETDHVRNYETRLLTKDGDVRNALVTLSRLRDKEGKPIGTFGISKDITTEKELMRRLVRSERELRDMVEYLEGIVENSADLIITVNPEGLIITFNRGAEETLGYSRSEVVGQRIEMLFADPRERDVAIARLKETDHVRNYEARFLTKNGDVRNVLLTLSRLRDKDGDPIGTFGISKDITTEKELLRKLVQSEKDAGIGRAVIAIQHAIKNMLNALRGGLYVIRVGQKKNDLARIEEGCAMVEEGLGRISHLSLNMLKYAREWTIDPKPTDLPLLVEKVADGVKDAAVERGVSLSTKITSALPLVQCDPGLIHMTLMDFVTNALDACEKKDYIENEAPQVVLEVSRAKIGRAAVIEIRDNGIGMTEDVKKNVFTPFFSTKGKWGTGLGLALSSRIIKLHRGGIAVESRLGEGSVFRITLPVDGPAAEQGEEDGQESNGD